VDWVQCSETTYHEGLEMAFFLQLHDDDGVALGQSAARARVAYRNYAPFSLEFVRRVVASGGSVGWHDEHERFTIPAAKSARSRNGTLLDAILVTPPGSGGIDVTARLKFKKPQAFLKRPYEELVVAWPPKGAQSKCVCCSRVFHM
jgi:hypothetical protein